MIYSERVASQRRVGGLESPEGVSLPWESSECMYANDGGLHHGGSSDVRAVGFGKRHSGEQGADCSNP